MLRIKNSTCAHSAAPRFRIEPAALGFDSGQEAKISGMEPPDRKALIIVENAIFSAFLLIFIAKTDFLKIFSRNQKNAKNKLRSEHDS